MICGKVFLAAQGVSSHYKSHIKKGTTEVLPHRCCPPHHPTHFDPGPNESYGIP